MNAQTHTPRLLVLFCLLTICLFLNIAEASTYSVLKNFNIANGANSYASLVQAANGNFYGTTEGGGSTGNGTVFKISSSGTLIPLTSFNGANGAHPYGGLIQGAGTDTNFYGTTELGGSSNEGTVFMVTPAGVLTTLASFNGANGAHPYASLIEDDHGNFYGTTELGGSSNQGTVFKLSSSGILTTLVNFNGTNGANPYAHLIRGQDGNFYGTTYSGGSSSLGTVFKVTPGGDLITTANFNGVNGSQPYGGMVQDKDGTFYGTTSHGGVVGFGTFFSLNYARVLTTLVNFNNTNGAAPKGDVVQGTDGEFYGTTTAGGGSGFGTIFECASYGGLNTLFNFSSAYGSTPNGGLVQATDGNFYGTATFAGSGNGVVYRLNATAIAPYTFTSLSAIGETNLGFSINGSILNLNLGVALHVGDVLTVIHNTGGTPISGTFANLPDGGTIPGSYGSSTYVLTANYSGNSGNDLTLTVQSVSGFSVLYNFPGSPFAEGGLVEGDDGTFYGTTVVGGTHGHGTVFKFTPDDGVVTTLVNFNGADGAGPGTSLIKGKDGNIYGTTNTTVFKVTPEGKLTTLAYFPNGSDPTGGLVEGSDGNFYGTTDFGGSYANGATDGSGNPGGGTVFKVTPGGVLTTLVSFDFHYESATGSGPSGGVVQGRGGDFYGTTIQGGSSDDGTVFKLSPTGVLTTLVNFDGTNNGANPVARLVEGLDGNFYGTTTGGRGYGTVFKVTPTGVLTTLVVFIGSNGRNADSGMILGNDGNFYGTTETGGLYGGIYGPGTLFRLTPTGTLTTLFSFDGTDGDTPSGLVQGTDGSFYGVTIFGGSGSGEGGGVIFRF